MFSEISDYAILDLDAEDPVAGVPSALGRGFLSTSGEKKGLLVPPKDNNPEIDSEADIRFVTEFIDSRSDYAKVMSWSAKAKFGGSGAGASARASRITSYKSSMRRVDLVIGKMVKKRKHYIRDPKWRVEALKLFEESPDAFLARYGDYFIKEIVMGGALFVKYSMLFTSTSEADEFKLSGTGSYGAADGSASFHQKITKNASKATVKMEAIAVGVDNAPPVFQSTGAGGEHATTELLTSDSQAASILKYFDLFEESVTDKTATVHELILERSDQPVNAPTDTPDLSEYNKVLGDAVQMDDEIEAALAKLAYLKDRAYKWNPHVESSDLHALEDTLERQKKLLGDAALLVANLEQTDLPIEQHEIPKIPRNWTCRDLEKRVGVDTHLTYRPLDIQKKFSFPVPPLYPGQYIKLKYRIQNEHIHFRMYWWTNRGTAIAIHPGNSPKLVKSHWQEDHAKTIHIPYNGFLEMELHHVPPRDARYLVIDITSLNRATNAISFWILS
jgi:hypothetical protein